MSQAKSAIIQSQDSFARSLAEKGYGLSNRYQNDMETYREEVVSYVTKVISEIWRRTEPEKDPTVDMPHSIITTSDLISRYVKFRFSDLFAELWVEDLYGIRDNRVFVRKPHAYYPHDFRGTFDIDGVTVGLESFYGYGQFRVFTEDDLGLGVIFTSESKPFAYGPRDFAERVHHINQRWDRIDQLNVTTLQALLLLIENVKNLTFQATK